MPKVAYVPEWKKFEKGIRSDNAQEARKSTDAFLETRTKEMATSKKARDYELSRREANAKDKPAFVKERIAKERAEDPMLKFNKEVKQAGVHENELAPAPGYLVVEIEATEQKTETGIYLPDNTDLTMINTGTLRAVGQGIRLDNGNEVSFPIPVGTKVLFKKGAGIEMKIKGKLCRFMMFLDILAFFY